MHYIQNFFLDLLERSDVPQKEAIYSFFKQFNKDNSNEHISNLEELENSQALEDVLFVDLSEETINELPYNLLKCKNLKSLDLSSTFINSIKGIGEFKNLEFLILNTCEQLKAIPAEIGELRKLKGIDISHSSIESLPKEFFTLKDIVYCSLNENELTNEILSNLEKLEYLVELHLDSNEMLNKNDTLTFRKLIKVDLSNNNFEIIPLNFSTCKSIEELNISNNPIQTLPASFSTLKSLRELDIRECLIENNPNLSKLISCEKVTLGHHEMKNIPVEVFSIPNLSILEIENSAIKSIPKELGHLSKLEHLSITDCLIITLPKSVGRLQKLSELELRDNHIDHLPSELANLGNLTLLSISNWNEGQNNLEDFPSWIGQLKSLSQLGLSNINIKRLPKEIGKLTNLSILDLSSNPLLSLPLEFSNLRKLKSLNLYDCPLDDMPEVQDMGIDELFEHLNKLRGVGKYSFNWELPESLQTAFQQYLNFFSNYIKKLKGFDIGLSVLKTDNGLKLETEATDDLSIENIGKYLNEYLDYIKENVDFKSVNENENPNIEQLRIQMENQINHFKQQLRQAEFENKYLRNSVDKLLEAQVNFSHAFNNQKLLLPSKNIVLNSHKKFEKIRTLIVENEFGKAFNDLSHLIKEMHPSRLNEVLVLNSRMTTVKLEARIGSIGFEQKQMEVNRIVSSLFELLESL